MNLTKVFAKNLIQSLPYDQRHAQSAIVTFGNYSTSLVAHLGQHLNASSLVAAIDSVQPRPGSTDYLTPLQYLKLLVYADNYGRRPGAARVAVLLLDTSSFDGLSYKSFFNSTIEAAHDARAIGVALVFVAIGSAYSTPLPKAVYDNPDNIIYVGSYEDLAKTTTVNAIEQKIELSGTVEPR